MGLGGLVKSAKRFGREIIVPAAIVGTGITGGCATTYMGTNYNNPEWFYSTEKKETEEGATSNSDLMATIGAVMGITADNERDAAIGSALQTYGMLKSQKEAAREGRTEVNVQQQNGPIATAVQDATRVPEYNLSLLGNFYRDGHLFAKMKVSENVFSGLPVLEDIFVPKVVDSNLAKIDGLQYLFTYNRAVDLNGDGLSFDEFLGVKRNFKREEPINVCVGVRGSAMKVKEEVNPSERKKTNAKIRLKLLGEERNVLGEKDFEYTFSNFNEDRLFFWDLGDFNLESGFYIVGVSYSDDFDKNLDRRKKIGKIKRENVLQNKITTLKQFFQISE